jgi:hypothetical protein
VRRCKTKLQYPPPGTGLPGNAELERLSSQPSAPPPLVLRIGATLTPGSEDNELARQQRVQSMVRTLTTKKSL